MKYKDKPELRKVIIATKLRGQIAWGLIKEKIEKETFRSQDKFSAL